MSRNGPGGGSHYQSPVRSDSGLNEDGSRERDTRIDVRCVLVTEQTEPAEGLDLWAQEKDNPG
jgi:hypothetical protein